MNIRDFVQAKLKEGESQSSIARKAKVSQATINKILHTETEQTLETLQKFATAYNLSVTDFIITEEQTPYRRASQLTTEETEMLQVFRLLPPDRRSRLIEDTNLVVIALRKSEESGQTEPSSKEKNLQQRSNG